MVSTPLMRLRATSDYDDESGTDTWADLGWTAVQAPRPVVVEVGIKDITARVHQSSIQHPAPTPVVGRGQLETPPSHDYSTVASTRTRTRRSR